MPAELGADPDGAVAAFMDSRERLFGVAYRILGSASEAEDVVQETWLRWQRTDRTGVRSSTPFLVTTATRIALNIAQSARARREAYVGPWLPEPVDTSSDPSLGAERAEALHMAVLLLMERLGPRQRAAYVLREAFDYPYDEIANVLSVSEASARKDVTRARHHLKGTRANHVDKHEHERLLGAFASAAQSGDLDQLERLLCDTVVTYSDGGGVVHASRRPIEGRPQVARFFTRIAGRVWGSSNAILRDVNGEPALLAIRDGHVHAALFLEPGADGIQRVMLMLNPTKLASLHM